MPMRVAREQRPDRTQSITTFEGGVGVVEDNVRAYVFQLFDTTAQIFVALANYLKSFMTDLYLPSINFSEKVDSPPFYLC